jgi:hypothetical protein
MESSYLATWAHVDVVAVATYAMETLAVYAPQLMGVISGLT